MEGSLQSSKYLDKSNLTCSWSTLWSKKVSESIPALRNRCWGVSPKMYWHAYPTDVSRSGVGSLVSTSCLTWRHKWSTGFNSGQVTGNHRVSMPNSDAKHMLPCEENLGRETEQSANLARCDEYDAIPSGIHLGSRHLHYAVPVLTFNTPYNTLFFRLPVMGTQVWPVVYRLSSHQ